MITQLQYDDSDLYKAFYEDQRKATGESHIVRDSGRYPLCGRGDVNTYTIFAENMRHMVDVKGRVGCIIPSGVATDDTTKIFFQDIMETNSLVSMFDFENRKNIFPGVGHGKFKFSLITFAGADSQSSRFCDFVFFALDVADLLEEDRHFSLSSEDLQLFNPNTNTCPIFRSKRDKEIATRIYGNVPILIREGPSEENPWNVKFSSMFHMTNDLYLFRSREQLEKDGWTLVGNIFKRQEEQYFPLYEGKMIWHFDHRFGTYEGLNVEDVVSSKLPELNDSQHEDPFMLPLPRYWIYHSHLPQAMLDGRTTMLVFRDITGTVLYRTAIFSIIPVMPCSNKLPVIQIVKQALIPSIFLHVVHLLSLTILHARK